MIVGKTPVPLVIWVHEPWAHHLDALKAQGHVIVLMDPLVVPHEDITLVPQTAPQPDIILHPAAHMWKDEMWGGPYLETALKAARKRKKDGGKG